MRTCGLCMGQVGGGVADSIMWCEVLAKVIGEALLTVFLVLPWPNPFHTF